MVSGSNSGFLLKLANQRIIYTWHNLGHGKQHLASFLATLNILFLLFHTLLELLDAKYRLHRAHLLTCKTFFDDLRALTRYLCFDSWEHLLTFMLHGLELDLPPNTS
jgi:hypothetical protein